MADEITVSLSLSFTKSPAATQSVSETSKSFDVTGAKFTKGVQNVGTSAEAIGLGDIGTAGWFFIKNLDTTNYVEVLDAVAGDACLKLKAGEFACGRFGAAAPAVKANTAACNVEYLIIED